MDGNKLTLDNDGNASVSLLNKSVSGQVTDQTSHLTKNGINRNRKDRNLLTLKILDRCKLWGCKFKNDRTVLVGLVITSVLMNVAMVTFIICFFIPKEIEDRDPCKQLSLGDSSNEGKICFYSGRDCQGTEHINERKIGNLCCEKTALSTIYLIQLILAESSFTKRNLSATSRQALFMYYPDESMGTDFRWSAKDVITQHSVFRTFRNQIELGLSGLYSIYMSVTFKYDSSRCKEKFSMGLTVKRNGKTPRYLFKRNFLLGKKHYSFQTEVFYESFWLKKEDLLKLIFTDVNCIQLYKPLNYMLIYNLK